MPATAFPSSRRLSWETLLDMPVGLAPSGPDCTGPVDRILLGGPGLRYPGPYTAGIQPGWLLILAVANTGRRRVRGADLASPLAFAFPGRQVRAAQISPQPAAKTTTGSARAPAILLPTPENPPPSPASRLVLGGEFLLRPGDGYAISVLLGGSAVAAFPAGTAGRRAGLGKNHHRAAPARARRNPAGLAPPATSLLFLLSNDGTCPQPTDGH